MVAATKLHSFVALQVDVYVFLLDSWSAPYCSSVIKVY